MALARIVSGAGVAVRVHAFLDGRDVPPRSAIEDLPRFEAALGDLPDVRIATRLRPLLRHGSRQALGRADGTGLRRLGERARPTGGGRRVAAVAGEPRT